jgi:hypothetical protein
MTDAPTLILVPAKITREMQRAYFDSIDKHMKLVETSAFFGRHTNNEIAYGAMLSASPFIEGVPVEVVERCAIAAFVDEYTSLQEWHAQAEGAREYWRSNARTVLLAAGLKVADNGK